MKKVVISIVTYNSSETIRSCLNSVVQQNYTDFELHVLDNNSSDNTRDILEEFKNTFNYSYYFFGTNTGFCGGHNYIINNSSSEYVLLLNPDAVLEPSYLANAIEVMEAHPECGTMCGLLLQNSKNDDPCLIDGAGMKFHMSGRFSLLNHGDNFHLIKPTSRHVAGADGAVPFYRREMITDIKINGLFFDELFFAHKEDWDVSWRAFIYGWKTYYSDKSVAYHPRVFKPGNRQGRHSVSKIIKYHAVKNQLLLYIKNLSLIEFIICSVSIIPRQIAILVYLMLFEPYSLKAYSWIIKNMEIIIKQRKIIQKKRKTSVLSIFNSID